MKRMYIQITTENTLEMENTTTTFLFIQKIIMVHFLINHQIWMPETILNDWLEGVHARQPEPHSKPEKYRNMNP